MKKQKGSILVVLLILLLVTAGLYVGFVYFQEKSQEKSKEVQSGGGYGGGPGPYKFEGEGEEIVVGMTEMEALLAAGDPDEQIVNSELAKTIWVYFESDESSTATFVYIKDLVVENVFIDEFTGSFESHTWLNE